MARFVRFNDRIINLERIVSVAPPAMGVDGWELVIRLDGELVMKETFGDAASVTARWNEFEEQLGLDPTQWIPVEAVDMEDGYDDADDSFDADDSDAGPHSETSEEIEAELDEPVPMSGLAAALDRTSHEADVIDVDAEQAAVLARAEAAAEAEARLAALDARLASIESSDEI